MLNKKKGLKLFLIVICCIVFIITGSLNTLLVKFQNETVTKIGLLPPSNFSHPFSQTWVMFFGNAFTCLQVHFAVKIFKWIRNRRKTDDIKKEKIKQNDSNQLFLLIPSAFYALSNNILNISLLMIYASIYQMLGSSIVVFTGLLSVIFLKSKIWKIPHRIFGILLIVIGTLTVGTSSLIFSSKFDKRNSVFGVLMVIFAQFLFGIQFVIEEFLLKKRNISAMEMVGYEGFFCSIFTIVVIFVMFFLPSSEYKDNFVEALTKTISNVYILVFMISLLFNCGIYNLTGTLLTQYVSATAKAAMSVITNSIVWGVQLLRGKQTFNFLQLIGFLVLVVGSLVYNDILLPFLPSYRKWVERIENQKKDDFDKDLESNKTINN